MLGDKCPHCNSQILNNAGSSRGKKRMKCRDCGRQWMLDAERRKRSGPPCYECGNPTRKDGTLRGQARVYCPDCNRNWPVATLLNQLEASAKFYWKRIE